MLVGIPPFYTSNRQELFERIKFAAPKYPPHLSKRARDLLEHLLKKDPAKRLGTEGDAQVIKNHPWFEGVNWKALYHKQYEAPFIPRINNEFDLSNFDPEFTEIAINSMSQNDRMTDMIAQQNYQGNIFIFPFNQNRFLVEQR
jgi:serine/threonine protein kinase